MGMMVEIKHLWMQTVVSEAGLEKGWVPQNVWPKQEFQTKKVNSSLLQHFCNITATTVSFRSAQQKNLDTTELTRRTIM